MPPKQILVIDDEDDIREVAKLSLQLTESWTVCTANGGAAGTALALSAEPEQLAVDLAERVVARGLDDRAMERDIPMALLTPAAILTVTEPQTAGAVI